jgi:hypothetical protein
MVCKAVGDVCKLSANSDVEKTAAVAAFKQLVESLAATSFIADDLTADVATLRLLGEVPGLPLGSSPAELKRYEQAFDDVTKCKKFLFQKPMTLFPCGMHMTGLAREWFDQYLKDKKVTMELDEFTKSFDGLSVPAPEEFMAKDRVVVPKLQAYTAFHEKLACIKAVGSANFLETHSSRFLCL